MKKIKQVVTSSIAIATFGSAAFSATPVEYEIQKLLASDGAADDILGRAVAIDGETVVVGSNGDDDNGSYSGSAYVFDRVGDTWVQQQKLIASDGSTNDEFSHEIDIDGDTLVVGATSDGDFGSYSGSAYVFVRAGGIWTQQQKIYASDAAPNGRFGLTAAISGNTIVVGATGDDESGSFAGAAYVFTRSSGVWTQQQKLTASDGTTNDEFGYSVAIDGDTIAVGAYTHDAGGLSNSGAVYVFTRSAGIWTQEQKLSPGDAAASDFFGISTSIAGDSLVGGAWGDDDKGSSSGSAYVFTRSGGVWTQQQKLTASDGAASDAFGFSVSIDGDSVAIGSIQDDDNGSSSGSVYVYRRTGGVWSEQLKLLASDGGADDLLGFRHRGVDISGGYVVAGAANDDDNGSNAGAAYIFDSIQTITVSIDIKPGSFPNSVNLCSNGSTPVAILGSDSFSVLDIETSTLRFAEAAVKVVGRKDPNQICSYQDVNSDSVADLVCQYVTTDIAAIDGESSTASVNGELIDGTPFEGTDGISVVKDTCF